MANHDEEYKIGYCKPPLETRFQAGQSGNPAGRPKKEKEFARGLQNELNTPVLVRKRRSVPRSEVLVRNLVDRALAGNEQALLRVFDLMRSMDRTARSDAARVNADVLERVRRARARIAAEKIPNPA